MKEIIIVPFSETFLLGLDERKYIKLTSYYMEHLSS